MIGHDDDAMMVAILASYSDDSSLNLFDVEPRFTKLGW